MVARRILCACCGQEGSYGGFGWRSTCYSRWVDAGRPETGPPPARPLAVLNRERAAKGLAAQREHARERRAKVRGLARNPSTTRARIAARLGVSVRTVERDLAALAAEPEGDAVTRMSPDRKVERLRRRPATKPIGADFANTRDLRGDVDDLLPERRERVIGHVRTFARDDAERAEFLDMLGLADYVTAGVAA